MVGWQLVEMLSTSAVVYRLIIVNSVGSLDATALGRYGSDKVQFHCVLYNKFYIGLNSGVTILRRVERMTKQQCATHCNS